MAESKDTSIAGKGTTIRLPLKEEMLTNRGVSRLRSDLHSIQPSLLLFLRKIRCITVRGQRSGVHNVQKVQELNEVESKETDKEDLEQSEKRNGRRCLYRKDLHTNIVEVTDDGRVQRWFFVSRDVPLAG